jgi:hypothetical protein
LAPSIDRLLLAARAWADLSPQQREALWPLIDFYFSVPGGMAGVQVTPDGIEYQTV